MTTYICSSCGDSSVSWYGRCPSCSEFNTLEVARDKKGKKDKILEAKFVPLHKIKVRDTGRIATQLESVNNVLGGGLAAGEAVLLSGEPGVGKSTLLLKMLSGLRVLYISGEESAQQMKTSANRVKADISSFSYSDEVIIESIAKTVRKYAKSFDVFVVDSIQTVYSSDMPASPGTVSQVKHVIGNIVELAKTTHIPAFIVGHITKGGQIAGPKSLEHFVDCVLFLEGERGSQFRIVRAYKNRFGSTDEVAILEMKKYGFVEVDKSTVFLHEDTGGRVGKAVVGVLEGNRPLFFEIQSLVVASKLSIPRRVVSGLDFNKVQLLLAVLRKHLKLHLDTFDVYVNVTGGVKINSTSADLGVVAAVISSLTNIPVAAGIVFSGEVGLLGEVRCASGLGKLKAEVKRYKFKKLYSHPEVSTVKDIRSLFV